LYVSTEGSVTSIPVLVLGFCPSGFTYFLVSSGEDMQGQSMRAQAQDQLGGAAFKWVESANVSACRAPGVGSTWLGIGCNEEGAVTDISLPGLNLGPAPLPASFAQLSQLREIDLQGNSLTGKYCMSAFLWPSSSQWHSHHAIVSPGQEIFPVCFLSFSRLLVICGCNGPSLSTKQSSLWFCPPLLSKSYS
jgi:hypothetical protein